MTPRIPRTALPDEVLRATLGALDRGHGAAIATVLARHGSAPSTPGQKLALLGDGAAVGTVGGGAVERAVLDALARALTSRKGPRVETFRLGPSLGMCCGGSVEILIEPVTAALHVLVVGAGHVGAYTAPLLASLGFRVTLADAREAAVDPARLAGDSAALVASAPLPSPAAAGVRVVHAEHDDPEVLRGFADVRARAAFLVMTHDHQLDQTAIEWALARGFGFVGGVGSRAKAARARARLEAKGLPAGEIARVRMPVGVDIGARSPAEIGVAIAGELVAWRASLHRADQPAAAEPDGAAPPERVVES